MSELILEVDENDNPIGTRPREDFHNQKLFHRSSVLFLFNDKEEVLLQKRSMSKDWFPGLYEFSVSGTTGNETDEECIRRETEEELGISDLDFQFLFKLTPLEKNDRAYNSVFLAKTSQKIKLDPEEVESVEWITMENLHKRVIESPDKFSPQLIIGLEKYLKTSTNI